MYAQYPGYGGYGAGAASYAPQTSTAYAPQTSTAAMPSYGAYGAQPNFFQQGFQQQPAAVQQMQSYPAAAPQRNAPQTTAVGFGTGYAAPAMNMFEAPKMEPYNFGFQQNSAFPATTAVAQPMAAPAAGTSYVPTAVAQPMAVQQQRPAANPMMMQAMPAAPQEPDPDDDPNRLPTFVKVRGLPAEHDPRIVRRPGKKRAARKGACC